MDKQFLKASLLKHPSKIYNIHYFMFSPVTFISIPKVIFFSTYSSCKMQRWCKFPTVSSGALKKGDSGGLGAKCFWSHHVCTFIVVVNPLYLHIRFCESQKHLQKYYISCDIFSYWSEEYWFHPQGRRIIKLGPELNETYQQTRFLSLFARKENCTLGQCVY